MHEGIGLGVDVFPAAYKAMATVGVVSLSR
jgi:hypothetical protein